MICKDCIQIGLYVTLMGEKIMDIYYFFVIGNVSLHS